jgi:zinc/manganese transport system substrate-binding protein
MRRLLLAVAALGLLTACSSATAQHGTLRVVAAENFYGNLITQIGGSHVRVTSILTDPTADPHLFAPGTSNGLAVARADVVVRNGLGYDDWMDRLLSAAPKSGRHVVSAADVLGVHGADANPHLWYDAPRMPEIVRAIGAALEAADPAHKADYATGVANTIAALQPLERAVEQLRARFHGQPVAYTERVPGYLLADAGLVVKTPPSFARAIEDGTGVAPADTNAMQRLLRDHQVKVLLYNEQAVTALTRQLQAIARSAGVPVVPVTETLPPHQTFEGWQLGQVQELAAALAQ